MNTKEKTLANIKAYGLQTFTLVNVEWNDWEIMQYANKYKAGWKYFYHEREERKVTVLLQKA